MGSTQAGVWYLIRPAITWAQKTSALPLRLVHQKIAQHQRVHLTFGEGARLIHQFCEKWCIVFLMSRTNIEINDGLIRRARKLTRLKTKRQIVDKALDLLVRSESRKGILRYYGSGVWKGNLKASRRNRA